MPKDLGKNENAPDDFRRLTDEEFNEMMGMLKALAGETRYLILEVLAKNLRDNARRYRSFNYYALTVDEINTQLNKGYSIATIQDHLNQLMTVGLIGRVCEGNNRSYAYYFNMFAIDCLLFEKQIFLEEMQSFMVLSDKIHEKMTKWDCVITVFTGMDKGEMLTLNKDETGYIGKNAAYNPDKYGSESLLLSSTYKSVTERHIPHLEVYYKNDEWFMVDRSEHGTFIFNMEVEKNTPVKLPNNTFIQLSRGPTSAVLYVSYN
ncbi:FHA domain-containing protein [Methanosphaera sp. BMS]|uniref:FHA domain-containing protein n=1 Tax=Methanosphaera sp. BMS TaxID=1789762 RepID=UPI000DC1F492|nr:FHA domain-containing protein [Methanosphaera sp. BMS]AWX31722.1 hypothetical protein AW729_00855 [Methanosphaera sp. BMS]